jgi:acyl-homoserine lactone acylase PvdQ
MPANEWRGWFTLDDLPHAENPTSGWLATANNNVLPPGEKKPIGYEWLDPARITRIREVLGAADKFDISAFERLQHDAIAWNAEQLVPLLEHLHIEDGDADRARRLLLSWDRAMARSSVAATIYATWEDQLVATLIADKIKGPLAAEFVGVEATGWCPRSPIRMRPGSARPDRGAGMVELPVDWILDDYPYFISSGALPIARAHLQGVPGRI